MAKTDLVTHGFLEIMIATHSQNSANVIYVYKCYAIKGIFQVIINMLLKYQRTLKIPSCIYGWKKKSPEVNQCSSEENVLGTAHLQRMITNETCTTAP